MNNIGFAATKNTAVNTNNNAASSTANLNSLATAFGGASSSVGGGFNSLILGLFIQIIQTLLKNMQNKPCCDQNNKPQTLPLEKLDTKKLLNALGDSGSSDNGTTTIDSIEDSDKSGELSVGDKINLKTVTRDPQTGADSVKYSSVKLTQEQLDRYQNPEDSELSLSNNDTLRLQQALSVDNSDNHWAKTDITAVIDKDGNGKLSTGDVVDSKIVTGYDAAFNPIYGSRSEALSQNQLNVFNNLANSPTLTDTQKANLALEINAGSGFKFIENPSILDNDQDGKLSAGDSILGFRSLSNDAFWSTQLSADSAKAVNGEHGKTLSDYTVQNENSPKKLALEAAINFESELPTHIIGVFDKDNSGTLSVGDIAVYDSNGATPAIGNPPPSMPIGPYIEITDTILQNANSQTENNLNLSDSQKAKLTESLTIDYKDPNVVAVKDNDKSGTLSAGDTVYLNSIETRTSGAVGGELGSVINSALSISQSQVDRFQSSTPTNTLDLTDSQKKVLDVTIGIDPERDPNANLPNVSSVIDIDNNGVLSVGDIVNQRMSAETAEQIVGDYYTYESYSSTPLTAYQLGLYQSLSADSPTLEVSNQERAWLQAVVDPEGATGGGYNPTALNLVYDNDNSGDVSVGDSLGVRQNKVWGGLQSVEDAYKAELIQLNQADIDKYNAAKNSTN